MSETRMTDFVCLTRDALEDVVRTIGPDGDGSRALILQTDATIRAALAAAREEIAATERARKQDADNLRHYYENHERRETDEYANLLARADKAEADLKAAREEIAALSVRVREMLKSAEQKHIDYLDAEILREEARADKAEAERDALIRDHVNSTVEVAALQAEVERLRAALAGIFAEQDKVMDGDHCQECGIDQSEAWEIARRALAGEKS